MSSLATPGGGSEPASGGELLFDVVTGYAHQIKIHALAKLGELLAEMPKRGAEHSRGGGSKGSTRTPLPDAPATYAELGLDKKTASVAQQLAALPMPVREAIASRQLTAGGQMFNMLNTDVAKAVHRIPLGTRPARGAPLDQGD